MTRTPMAVMVHAITTHISGFRLSTQTVRNFVQLKAPGDTIKSAGGVDVVAIASVTSEIDVIGYVVNEAIPKFTVGRHADFVSRGTPYATIIKWWRVFDIDVFLPSIAVGQLCVRAVGRSMVPSGCLMSCENVLRH